MIDKLVMKEIRATLKLAKKSGSGWKMNKTGQISCKDGYCLMAAVTHRQEVIRDGLIAEAMKKLKKAFGLKNLAVDEFHDSNAVHDAVIDSILTVDKFVDPDMAAQNLGISMEAAEILANANDNDHLKDFNYDSFYEFKQYAKIRELVLRTLRPKGMGKWLKALAKQLKEAKKFFEEEKEERYGSNRLD